MKILVGLMLSVLMISLVLGSSYDANIKLDDYDIDVDADIDVKNVKVDSDGNVEADIDVKTNTNVNGQAVNQENEYSYKVKKQGDEVEVEGEMKMANGETIRERVRINVSDVAVGQKYQLSNGNQAEVKIMPSVASERALEALNLSACRSEEGCVIELKEVGSGKEVKLSYELKAEKEAKFLGLFRTRMEVKANIDADSGEVISTGKPWWSFLASEN